MDPTRSDAASRWVLRELRRVSTRPPPEFVPPLELVPLPAWTRPAPRRSHIGRQVYRPHQLRRRLALRLVCRVLPFVSPLVRRIF
jgi:hypothetical protein